MRQRALTAAGDFSFGTGLPLLRDSPACVAQAVMTRLRLSAGEWFLDLDEGTPYDAQVLGHASAATRDLALRARILDTPGVTQIAEYVSFVGADRAFVVVATVDTDYGRATVATTL